MDSDKLQTAQPATVEKKEDSSIVTTIVDLFKKLLEINYHEYGGKKHTLK